MVVTEEEEDNINRRICYCNNLIIVSPLIEVISINLSLFYTPTEVEEEVANKSLL